MGCECTVDALRVHRGCAHTPAHVPPPHAQDIEEFLERPVFLELSVQCSQKWRDNKEALKSYGYYE